MSSNIEFEEKNVELAVEKACSELNIPKEKLKHNIISYGSTGIFGIVGTKKARIRVSLPEGISKSKGNNAEKEIRGDDDSNKITPEKEKNKKIEQKRKTSIDLEETKNIGMELLTRIADFITTDASVSIDDKGGRLTFNIKGGNSGVLIGKRGQTLEAIQYLTEKIINKKREERVRVNVDVEGYMKKRRISLQSLSKKLAQKVKRTGKPASLGQMNSYDRRIVHIALKDDNDVRTKSIGDGVLRKLVILPKKNHLEKTRVNSSNAEKS